MSTAAQQTASRQNAQRSTGPRTPEGKAASSQNANRHNLTGRLHLREDEAADFAAFEASHRSQLAPTGALEITLFEQLISSGWNLRRIEALESEILAQGSPAEEAIARQLDRLARYRGQHERSFYRALRELEKRQTLREIIERIANPTRLTYAPLADLNQVKRIGFVLASIHKQPDSTLEWLKSALQH